MSNCSCSCQKTKEENSFSRLRYSSGSEPGSRVGIARGYGLDGPGIEFTVVSRISSTAQIGP